MRLLTTVLKEYGVTVKFGMTKWWCIGHNCVGMGKSKRLAFNKWKENYELRNSSRK